MGAVVVRAQEAGTLRPDVSQADLFVLFGGIIGAPADVPAERRGRCLSIILDGLRCGTDGSGTRG